MENERPKIKLELMCQNVEEAQMYLNAAEYFAVIDDVYQMLRTGHKHGTNKDMTQEDLFDYLWTEFHRILSDRNIQL